MKRKKSFAEIVSEESMRPAPPLDVRAGAFNVNGELFDPSGRLLTRQGGLTPAQATEHVRSGALLAFEGCGCGGWSGCQPEWVDAATRRRLADAGKPRFVKSGDVPTWIDLWRSDGSVVVFAHGDVAWADVWGGR